MNTKIFEIEYSRLIRLLLPTFLRTPVMLEFLQAFTEPLLYVYERLFLVNRENNLFRIEITSSVCKLEYLLNKLYFLEAAEKNVDRNRTRIRIGNVERKEPLYIYLTNEVPEIVSIFTSMEINTDEEKNPQYLYKRTEIGETVDDFVVIAPNSLNEKRNDMFSVLRSYALPDKKYSIVFS
ncbi:MAG: hypothetical protein FWF54_00130 [Candidatus Azobacteroides sp.]|nr:hypothetical protein [Candidatus Azobacteroides sp.]